MISTTDLSIAVAIASATGTDTAETPTDESPNRTGIQYYQMHHNHHAHQAQSQGHNHSHNLYHQQQQQSSSSSSQYHQHHHHHHQQQQQHHSGSHHHAHLQHLLQHFGDPHTGSPYGPSSRPGSATTPTTVMDDPSGQNADTCSSVSSTTIFGARICNVNCRCTNRLLTGIVITILPIAITSTLLFVFMMQKTNLHQYAIYSFVIFCVAFVFPFALFFFTVILNKIYKFYKRGIRSPHDSDDIPDLDAGCDDPFQDSHLQHAANHHHHHQQQQQQQQHHPGMEHHNHVHLYHDPASMGGNSNLVYYQPYYFTTMTYHPGDIAGMGVNCATNNHHDGHYQISQSTGQQSPIYGVQQPATILTENAVPYNAGTANIQNNNSQNPSAQESLPNSASSQSIEDSPPCYEMALLCPSVTSDEQLKTNKTGTGIDTADGYIKIQSYSPAKDALLGPEKIEYNEEIGSETIHLHHSTPSTSRNPSQEEEVEPLSNQADVDDDKCSND